MIVLCQDMSIQNARSVNEFLFEPQCAYSDTDFLTKGCIL